MRDLGFCRAWILIIPPLFFKNNTWVPGKLCAWNGDATICPFPPRPVSPTISLCIFCQILFNSCLGRMCLGFLGLSVVQVIFANGSSTVLKMFPPHQKWLSGCLLLSSGYYSNIGKKERPPSLPPRPPPHHFTAGKSGHKLCHHKSGNCTLKAYWLKCSYHVKGGMITKCILQVDIKHGMSKIYIYLDHQIPRHLGRTFLGQKCFKGVG